MFQQQDLTQQADLAYEHMLRVFPLAKKFHPSLHQRLSVDQSLKQPLQEFNRSEKSIIFDKLRQTHRQSLSSIPPETLLYLEQQLGDIFGLALTSETSLGTLPYLVGHIEAQPHLKSSPTDASSNHASILEAGLRPERSYYGWQSELYGITLPLHELAGWQTLADKERKAFLGQLTLVINPLLEIAVIAKIVDVGPYHTQRYQFAGSPQLVREGKFWNPGCNGLSAIFFLESNSTHLKTGPLSYEH